MAATIYFLCASTALACFVLLWRAWRAQPAPLLLWSALCFAGLTATNVLLVLDKLAWPQVDLTTWRLAGTLASLALLLFGLVWSDGK